jgi:hypothetical protein
MSAERDRNVRVIHGAFYTVREMRYLCDVEAAQFPANSQLKKTIQSMRADLESLPGNSLVSYVLNPETQIPSFKIAYVIAEASPVVK